MSPLDDALQLLPVLLAVLVFGLLIACYAAEWLRAAWLAWCGRRAAKRLQIRVYSAPVKVQRSSTEAVTR